MSLTKEQMKEARNWCLDCQADEEGMERVKESSDKEIIRLVDKNFYDGIKAFLETFE